MLALKGKAWQTKQVKAVLKCADVYHATTYTSNAEIAKRKFHYYATHLWMQ
jgi:hypothetical protein